MRKLVMLGCLAAVWTGPLCAEKIVTKTKAAPSENFFALDAGVFITNLDDRLTAPSGFASYVSTLAGFARLRGGVGITSGLHWEPGIGALVPFRSGADGSTKTFTFQLEAPIAWTVFPSVRLRFGPGMQWLWMSSAEQPVSLNNGTTTSTFYTPGGSSHSFTWTAQAGLWFGLSSQVWIGADVYVVGLLSEARRRFNGALTLGFQL